MKNTLLLVLAFLLLNCKDGKKSEYKTAESTTENELAEAVQSHPGKKIMETECYICHDPNASQESMIAPPLVAVKKYYIGENTTKDQFTKDLIQWVNDPETESKMPDALLEFGSMPYIPYPDDAIAQIAEYIYENDIVRPKWYDKAIKGENGKGLWMNRNMVSKEIQESNAQKGMAYAKATQKALGQNLLKAIGEKGTLGAIEFCNIKALHLTDSMSVMNNAIIKRVSDKPRNQKNEANKEELGYITYFKKLIAAGKEPKPIVKREQGEVEFYYPITTNAMCLQCHGKPNEQITPETLTTLQNLYPKDQAIGYDANEVRGLWVVNFDEEK
jgi:cytochrome c553